MILKIVFLINIQAVSGVITAPIVNSKILTHWSLTYESIVIMIGVK